MCCDVDVHLRRGHERRGAEEQVPVAANVLLALVLQHIRVRVQDDPALVHQGLHPAREDVEQVGATTPEVPQLPHELEGAARPQHARLAQDLAGEGREAAVERSEPRRHFRKLGSVREPLALATRDLPQETLVEAQDAGHASLVHDCSHERCDPAPVVVRLDVGAEPGQDFHHEPLGVAVRASADCACQLVECHRVGGGRALLERGRHGAAIDGVHHCCCRQRCIP
mmetsp:Transcript_92561/g.266190  ORF Transcript_92561/g.266190 Transcript_92561/m.266190 type:complete len:226 (+) Transcript_92561:412-1089(+)